MQPNRSVDNLHGGLDEVGYGETVGGASTVD
jgi:hypothetical protein